MLVTSNKMQHFLVKWSTFVITFQSFWFFNGHFDASNNLLYFVNSKTCYALIYWLMEKWKFIFNSILYCSNISNAVLATMFPKEQLR